MTGDVVPVAVSQGVVDVSRGFTTHPDGPPPPEARRVAESRERLESAWRAGDSLTIETILREAADVAPAALFRELLAVELTLRAEAGESPTVRDVRERFPDKEEEILSVFEELGFRTGVGPDPVPTADHRLRTVAEADEPADETVTQTGMVRTGVVLPETKRDPRPRAGIEEGPPRERIGRYRVEGTLGEGGFGRVYLALDTELDRRVAIKLPPPSRIDAPGEAEAFLDEARLLAELDHPGIVPIFDVGRTDDGLCYIVSKHIDGRDLRATLKGRRPGHREAAMLVADVAEALHYAHSRGLVHRDVKASNILLDGAGRSYLADFGLALRERDFGTGPVFAGTVEYMSPEQARGEGHLVDARSDVFSLGVVFYELLTGDRPFKGVGWRDTVDRITGVDPSAPREVNPAIPRELERICLRALAKPLDDRYASALELADDLRHALAQAGPDDRGGGRAAPASDSPTISVASKGLRSFEAEDADAFLRLLPGPRDRMGLPESLRFWKRRIESEDGSDPFRVGLVYGPSGSGKSSLIKAGLIPRLGRRVQVAFVEAAPDDTEARLAAAVLRKCPGLPEASGLTGLLAAVRRGRGLASGRKLLVVIDQFEQWLHARDFAAESELARALRQSDGVRVQAMLIVRDDFWMSVTRFLQLLDVRLAGGENCAAVDLFDVGHAAKILTAFGRASGALPPGPAPPSKGQAAFVDLAVAELARGGKVIPVQLSLFAEMVDGRPWTQAALRELGGARGVGVRFLEDAFGAPAPPHRRLHQAAAREVLKLLLPGRGAEIKGHLRTRAELLAASGYDGRPSEFEDLLRVLDPELRLITPSEPHDGPHGLPPEPRYGLAHDYLVPVLREWLTAKQRETRGGRAEIRLAERVARWSDGEDARQLPTLVEWLSISALTRRDRHGPRERAMMAAATRHHLLRVAVAAVLAAALASAGAWGFGRFRSEALVDTLLAADVTRVPEILRQMGPYRRWTAPSLIATADDPSRTRAERLNARLALVAGGFSPPQALLAPIREATPEELRAIAGELAPHRGAMLDRIWEEAKAPASGPDGRFRAACALAALDPDAPGWSAIAPGVAATLLAENPLRVKPWVDILRPARRWLAPPIADLARSPTQSEGPRMLATDIVVDYAADDPALLADLAQDADPRQLALILPRLAADGGRAVAALRSVFRAAGAGGIDDASVVRRANAAAALFLLGEPDAAWSLLGTADDPRPESELIHALTARAVDPSPIVAKLAETREPAARRTLILALADLAESLPEPTRRDRLIPEALAGYRDDPDPGVHAATRLLLRRLGRAEDARAIDRALEGVGRPDDRAWFVDQGHTMVVIDPIGRDPRLSSYRRIGRVFAISDTEVTLEQLRRFVPDHPSPPGEIGPDSPATVVTWYLAARYCRWLDERAGIAEDQRCYPPLDQIKEGMVLKPGYLRRTGHRLPTYAEWSYAGRGGATTDRYYGNRDELLGGYAWFRHNTSSAQPYAVGRRKPNAFGLFDVIGGLYEWCGESVAHCNEHPDSDSEDPTPVTDGRQRAIRGGSFTNESDRIRPDHMAPLSPPMRWDNVGFRVARTIRVPD